MVRRVYLGQNFELRKEIGILGKLEIIFLYLLYILIEIIISKTHLKKTIPLKDEYN
jgi:hypothetical protein